MRRQLSAYMREKRLAMEPVPTQKELSSRLGYTYSIVSNWENDTRNVLREQFQAWAEAVGLVKVGIPVDFSKEPFASFEPVLLPDDQSKPNKGERIEREINVRVQKLRKDRNLSIRELGKITGINYSHYARIERGQSNFSITQLRSIAKELRVSYEYLIDGTNEEETVDFLRKQNAQLRRENELLESFRQSTLANR